MKTNSEPRPQLATITSWDYIKANFPPTDRLAVVIINSHQGQVIQRIDSATNIASPDFQRWLRGQNAHGGNVYVSMNPLKEGARQRTKDNVKTIRHLYLDFDENGSAAVDRVLEDPRLPDPSYVVNTSPGKYHVIWRVEEFSLSHAERLQRAMAAEFGADRAATDISRVLRIPGFHNKKYSEPFQVTAQMRSDSLYRPEHFRINLAQPESEARYRDIQDHGEQGSQGEVPGRRLSQSERDWAYAKRKLATGHDPEEVIRAIAEYRLDKHDPAYYARHTVEKALAELSSEQSTQNSRSPVDR